MTLLNYAQLIFPISDSKTAPSTWWPQVPASIDDVEVKNKKVVCSDNLWFSESGLHSAHCLLARFTHVLLYCLV